MNDPSLYANVNSITRLFVGNFTKEHENELGEMSGRCLDIGSGPGDVTVDLILPKLSPEATIVCSDISDSMVNFAAEKYKDNPRLSFMKLDIETRDLPEDLIEHFDHIISTYCLHWCQNMRQVFENIFNLLRPGGTSFIIFIANFPGLNAYEKLAAMPSYQPYMEDVDRYIPVYQRSVQPHKALEALVKDVGFEVHLCTVREHSFTHENPLAFSNFMLSVNPFIERIPADIRKEYGHDLAKEATEQSIVLNNNNGNESDYSILCMYKTLIVHLRKPLTVTTSTAATAHAKL